MIVIKVLAGILVCVAGATIRLPALYHATTSFIAGFAALSSNKLMYTFVSYKLKLITTNEIAVVVTFLVLTLVPLLLTIYFGLRIAAWINFDEWLTPVSSAVLGAAYSLIIFIVILYLI